MVALPLAPKTKKTLTLKREFFRFYATTLGLLHYPFRCGLTQILTPAAREWSFYFSAFSSELASLLNKKPPLYSEGFVTALGFKPKTFSSVVRCSIQLSYAAKIFWTANIMLYFLSPQL